MQIRRGGVVRAGMGRVVCADDERCTSAMTAYEHQHGLRPVGDDQVILIENLTPLEGDT